MHDAGLLSVILFFRKAENMLRNMDFGTFLIRLSESHQGYSLSVKCVVLLFILIFILFSFVS